jgi:hypothetical protein
MNERAQSIGLARVFLYFGVGALVIGLLYNEFGAKILQNSQEAATNGTASQAVTWSQQAMNLWPIFVLLTGFLAVVVLAIYQREIR